MPAKKWATTRSSRCSTPAGPRSRPSPRSPTTSARRAVGDEVTWVANRNINYTNVCTFKCKFCGFSKGPLSLNLRGTPYLLTLDDIAARARRASDLGATEVCLQGGIHPDFDGDYYIDVARAVKDAAPDIHIHGFTALEVTEGARRLGEPLDRVSPPADATPACDHCPAPRPRSSTTTCGPSCAPTRSTPSSGSTPTRPPIEWACDRTSRSCSVRSSSRCTGPATSCAPAICSSEPAGSPSSYRCRSCTWRRRSTCNASRVGARRSARPLLMHAVGRIAYHGHIDNIQASWVKIGVDGVRQLLQAGVNDLGGTLMNENISPAAGAAHGQGMDRDDFAAIVEPLGRRSRSARPSTVGSRRPTPRGFAVAPLCHSRDGPG